MAKQQKATNSWIQLEGHMKENLSKRAYAILLTMDNEEYMRNYLKLLEFVVPKLQRKEIVSDVDPSENVITVKHVMANEKDAIDVDADMSKPQDDGTKG